MSFYVEYNPPRLNIDTGIQIARGGGGGGEISDALKQALLQMAEKVAYIDADGQDYYQDLYDALYPITPTYTITNNLTDVTNSNSATSATEGSAYTATLSCAPNYEITSVTITMGGNDVTGTAYAGGTISIPNVTGNIVITAVATQSTITLTSISASFTQGQNVVYDVDSLDALKQYLTVTALWSDSSTSEVSSSDYTLSGTLTVGTSTITVSYGGKSDTFSVTVSAKYYYDLTDGLTKLNSGVTPSNAFGTVHTTGEIILTLGDSGKRRGFPTEYTAPRCMKSTTKSAPYEADLSDTNYYPIKIPADATGVTCAITPNTQYVALRAYTYDDTNHYQTDAVTGQSLTAWKAGSASLAFTAGSYQYFSVVSKYNSSGSSYPTEPSALTITFTK